MSDPKADTRGGRGRPAWPTGRVADRLRVLTVATVALVAAFATLVALTLHQREIRDTRQRVMMIDTLLAEETSRTLKAVDLVLTGIVEDYGRDHATLAGGAAAGRVLESRLAGLPQVGVLAILDKEGRVVASSRPSMAARQWSPEEKADLFGGPARPLAVGLPRLAPGLPATLPLARRIVAPDGSVAGYALAEIDLDNVRDLYRSLDLGRGLTVGLWRRDGVELARYPTADAEGRADWLDEIGAGQGATYETSAGFDGQPRIVAARTTNDMNLVVTVSARRSQALADWRLFLVFLAAAAVAAAGAVVVAGEALRSRYLALGQRDAALAEREQAADQRARAEAQLRQSQKMEAVGQIAGGIAHDFNNMLSVVVGSLELLGRRVERGDRDVGRYVGAAREAAERASSLSRRLLAHSRQQEIAPEASVADGLLVQSAEIARRTIGQGVRFDVLPDAPGRRILVDPNELENAILNLAINARDAMPAGGSITLSSGTTLIEGPAGMAEHVVISLRDTGTGMPEEVAARARDPFFTTKAEGSGTGLGLSQVAGFCERSGGRMDIRTRLGEGTTVSLVLPVTDAQAGSRVGSQEVPGAPADGAQILVVDDEDAVRETTVAMLRDLGYRVTHARDPRSALDIVAAMPGIDLVVSDLVMPTGDGLGLLREVARIAPGTKGLIVSGIAVPDDGPVTVTLSKPFDLGQLARAVRDALATGDAPARGGTLAA